MKSFKDVVKGLEQELDKSLVKKHPYTGFDYLEGYSVINMANEVFDYDGWSLSVLFEFMKEYSLPATEKGTVRGLVSVPVEIDVTILDKEGKEKTVSKGDVGTCVWNGQDQIETAIKGAVTDGMKRCFRHFGQRFGNDLYKGDVPVATDTPTKPFRRPQTTTPTLTQPSNTPTCDVCGAKMVLRNGRFGPFFGCSTYPVCQRLVRQEDVDEKGNIMVKQKPAKKATEEKEDIPFPPEPDNTEEINIEDVPF